MCAATTTSGKKSTPLLNKLSQRIVAFISGDKLEPETHLGEEFLAQRFKVSRTPVRAALELLASLGVVEKRPNKGFFVIADPKSIVTEPLVEEEPDDQIYFRVVEDRLDNRLPEKISELELRRRYALTKTGVASLLRRMTQEGWIARLPGHGWEFLPVLVSEEAYDQGYQFRALIEPAALLTEDFYLSPETINKLRSAQLAMLDGGISKFSNTETFQIGAQFHESLVSASGNMFFADAVKRMNRARRLLDYRTQNDRSRLVQTCKEHLALLDLIEANKLQEASDFLRSHLEQERKTKVPLTRRSSAEAKP